MPPDTIFPGLADQQGLAPGFDDAVLESQAAFRVLLAAMARPARPLPLTGIATAPPPLLPTAAALALTLLDSDTPLWLDPPLATAPSVRCWLAFHSGAPLVASPAEAAFALVAEPTALPSLECFALGDERYPDRSTTLILQVEGVTTVGPRFSGPGFARPEAFSASPLPADFWGQVRLNAALFPRGVDLIFAAPSAIAALPRSTRPEAG